MKGYLKLSLVMIFALSVAQVASARDEGAAVAPADVSDSKIVNEARDMARDDLNDKIKATSDSISDLEQDIKDKSKAEGEDAAKMVTDVTADTKDQLKDAISKLGHQIRDDKSDLVAQAEGLSELKGELKEIDDGIMTSSVKIYADALTIQAALSGPASPADPRAAESESKDAISTDGASAPDAAPVPAAPAEEQAPAAPAAASSASVAQ